MENNVGRLVMLKKQKTKGPLTIINGFPGIGLVGNIAANHLIDSLGLPMVGYVESAHIPPIAVIHKGAILPPLRIYQKDNMMVVCSDTVVSLRETVELSSMLGEWFEKQSPAQVISLAGIGVIGQTQQKFIFGTATNEALTRKLTKNGVTLIKEGVISGMSGQLLLECAHRRLPSICLLAQTDQMKADPGAAAVLIQKLNEVTGMKVDVSALNQEAEKIKERMKSLAEQMQKQSMEGTEETQEMYR